jgi:dTDP-4-amino-4,6-dideoxygalactose transaminase
MPMIPAGLQSRIDFVALRQQYDELKTEIDRAMLSVVGRSAFIGGPELDEFESWFASFCGTRHAVGVGSGTVAIEFVLRAHDFGAGDEVIVPAHTFIASAAAVVAAGTRPVLVDVDERTGNLDPDQVESAIGPRTKAILAVHLHGRPARMNELLEIAEQHQLLLIEDAAQAHGALYHGRRVGSIGAAGCFSFYPTKNLGAFGDGGIVTTDDATVETKIKRLRDHGRVSRYEHETIGFTARLDNLQAAVLRVQADRLDDWNARRRRAAKWYREALPAELTPAADEVGVESVYHLFAIRIPRRDAFRAHLEARGVPTAIHYPLPLHLQPALRGLGYSAGQFPVSERLAAETLSLPMHPFLREADVEYIADATREFLQQ